jgi:phage N-6-adenine-methyltransferase
MPRHADQIMHSSKFPNWRTPKALFDRLHQEFRFDLDAAADAASALCPRWLGPGSPINEDGLDGAWPSSSAVFLNPPYSREEGMDLDAWVIECYLQSHDLDLTIVAVLPYAPQTVYFRQCVMGWGSGNDATKGDGATWSGHAAREIRLIPHRVNFELSPEDFAAYNQQRVADGKPPLTKLPSAGVNTCIVIWDPGRGIVGPWQPQIRYWSYR